MSVVSPAPLVYFCTRPVTGIGAVMISVCRSSHGCAATAVGPGAAITLRAAALDAAPPAVVLLLWYLCILVCCVVVQTVQVFAKK